MQVRVLMNLMSLKTELERTSVLKFTHELSVDKKLPFLDVLVHLENDCFKTSVYHKPTDAGACLNANSECPERYKISVLSSYLKRAYAVCSDWTAFNSELDRIKQTLVNNGYSNSFVDKHTRRFLSTVQNQRASIQNHDTNTKMLYYKNQMSDKYVQDEHAVKQIIRDNVKVKNPSDRLKFVIYYQNIKSCNLVMKNNMYKKTERQTARSRVVYEFKCIERQCIDANPAQRYIGQTQCSLSRRLSMHLFSGAIQDHFLNTHQRKITREEIVNNTTIRYGQRDARRLHIIESLLIKAERPVLNGQDTGVLRVLKLFA